ncbi:MAG: AMP-binding protein [Deltaproteobacteria bacterium]|nr:AMP-binding protein [Deltaproteobacteria bacterium]
MKKDFPNIFEHFSYVRHDPGWGAEPVPPAPEGNFYDLVKESVYRFPLKTALVFMGREVTYREMDELSDRLATALVAMGVRKGDRIAVVLPLSIQAVLAFHAVIKLGAISVPCNVMFQDNEMSYILNDSGAQTVICLDLLCPLIDRIKGRTGLRHVISVYIRDFSGPDGWVPPILTSEKQSIPGTVDFMELLESYPPTPPAVTVNSKEDTALIIYTAGTTGPPKGVMETHYSMINACLAQCHTVGCDHDFVNLQILPMFHIGGYYLMLHPMLYKGGTVVLMPMFDAAEYLRLIDTWKVDSLVAIPTVYIALLGQPDLKSHDLGNLKVCIAAGAPVPSELQKRWHENTGIKLSQGWGMTECNAGAIVNLPNRSNPDSIGVPVAGEAKIVNPETGEILPRGETGELMYRGLQVAKGYWNKPEDTKETFQTDGWLHTGDACYMDEEGFIFFVDRIKDLIIASGYNISPFDVESDIMQHPAVMEVAVIGVPDEYRGETVKACVVLKEEFRGKTTEEDILEFCKEKMATYKRPRIVEFIDMLPKSAIGKVLRRKLRERSGTEE